METMNQRKRKADEMMEMMDITLTNLPSKVIQRVVCFLEKKDRRNLAATSQELKNSMLLNLYGLPSELIMELYSFLDVKGKEVLSLACVKFKKILGSKILGKTRLIGSLQIDDFIEKMLLGPGVKESEIIKAAHSSIKQLRIKLSDADRLKDGFNHDEAIWNQANQLISIAEICPSLKTLNVATRDFRILPESFTNGIKIWSNTLSILKILDNRMELSTLSNVLVSCGSLEEVYILGLSNLHVDKLPLSHALLHHPSLRKFKIEREEYETLFDTITTLGSTMHQQLGLTSIILQNLSSIDPMMKFLSSPVSANLKEIHLRWITTDLEGSDKNLESTQMNGDLVVRLESSTITPTFYKIVGKRIKILHCYRGHHKVNLTFKNLLAAIEDCQLPGLKELHIKGSCNCCEKSDWSSEYKKMKRFVKERYGLDFIFKVPYDIDFGTSICFGIETAVWKKWQNK